MITRTAPAILALLAPSAAAAAADWPLLQGSPGGLGDVIVVDDLGVATPLPELVGIELLDVDFVGRTLLERLVPDRPRYEPFGSGASRLALPAGHGSLYGYRRVLSGADRFGLFVVTTDGDVRVLLDRPGVGVAGDDAPFSTRVACAPDGAALLVATGVQAGGDLLEIDVATGATIDRTAGLAPFEFTTDGLGLQSTWGVALTAAGAQRFDRAPGALAAPVPVAGGTPPWFGDQVVFSGDGLTAGLLAGDGPDAARVATFRALGSATFATMPPAALDGAGFLPEAIDGPWLALSDDGAWVGYRTREPKPAGGLSREVWLAPAGAAGSSTHVTADANFVDTIDEVGLLRFVPGAGLMFGAGEPNDGFPVGLDQIDLYLAPTAGGPDAIVNLTQSSGDLSPPFTSASLSTEDGVYAIPGTDLVVLHDSESGGGSLLGVDVGAAQVLTLLPTVKELGPVAWTGAHLVASIRRDTDPKRRELVAVDPSSGAQILAVFPEDTVLEGLSAGPTGAVGLVITLGASEWLGRVDPLSGAGALLTPLPADWVPTLAWTPAGALRATLAPTFLPGLHVQWSPSGGVGAALSPPVAGVVLPAH